MGGARYGKSFFNEPRGFLLVLKVNGKLVSVDVRNKCPMHEVVQFVAREYKVPARLIEYVKAESSFGCANLIYNN